MPTTKKAGSRSTASSTPVEQLELVELMIATSDVERIAIRQRHFARLKEIESREKVEEEVGRGTEADVAEATWHRMQAEFGLKTTQARTSDIDLLLRRLSELERKVDQLQKERSEKTSTRP